MAEQIKTNRGIVKFFLLGLITFGIYTLVFWHHYARDINIICEDDGGKTQGLGIMLLLSLVTLGIYFFVWKCMAQNRLRNYLMMNGQLPPQKGGVVICWELLGLLIAAGPVIAQYIICKTINQAAFVYNRLHMGMATAPSGAYLTDARSTPAARAAYTAPEVREVYAAPKAHRARETEWSAPVDSAPVAAHDVGYEERYSITPKPEAAAEPWRDYSPAAADSTEAYGSAFVNLTAARLPTKEVSDPPSKNPLLHKGGEL